MSSSNQAEQPDREKMFSLAPMPIFSTWEHHHRPAIPSPLSSSPARASSPLSPIDENALPQRQVQSSPITASDGKFRFASRPLRRNPLVRKREDAQEGRRRSFLQSVRQRADEHAWERRDVENTVLKSDWQAEVRSLEQARLAAADATLFESDIEDEPRQVEEPAVNSGDVDDVMVDELARQEESEMDAMIRSFFELSQPQAHPTPSSSRPSLSDDEDYDQLFMDIALSQESPQIFGSQQMDMS